MKKYLMTGIAAIAMCAAFTSCSHDTGFETMTQEDLDKAKYEATFVARFGQPAADQDWGFGQFKAGAITRVADPGDHGAYFSGSSEQQSDYYKAMGIVAPDMVSEDEENFVTNWFRTHPDPESENVDLSTFFVQQVHFGTQEYTTSTGHKVVGGNQMDWLCAYDPAGHTEIIYGQEEFGYQPHTYTTHDDHINNFNTSAPLRYYKEGGWTNNREYQASMMLMVNSSTERFGFSESFNTNPPSSDANRNPNNKRIYYNYVLVSITYNGKTNYYVGFDYECHGNQGDLEPNGLYDDRIIKIVPGNGSPTPPTPPVTTADVRVIAEDLTVSEKGDFDFNDVVFDVYYNYNNTGKTAIELQAAGGTYPLYVAGHEVHLAFGQATNVMINTGAGPQLDPVLIPLDQAYTDANDILVQVDKGNGLETLTAEVGRAPHKIAVIPSFPIMHERDDIETHYKGFRQWVQDPQYRWY